MASVTTTGPWVVYNMMHWVNVNATHRNLLCSVTRNIFHTLDIFILKLGDNKNT